jgi:hypothetical protein
LERLAQQRPFPVTSTVDAPTIAGHPVQLDAQGKLLKLAPYPHWANSTGYLRAMMQGLIERLYPYTGDARTLEFLQSFVDYELENGSTLTEHAFLSV